MTENVLQKIVQEFRELLEPIAQASGDPEIRREILLSLNLDPAQATQPIDIPPSALDSIGAYTSAAAEDVDLDAFASVVQDILQIFVALESFINAASANSSDPFGMPANEAINAYLNMLTLGYVRVRWPGFYIGLKVLGLIEEQAVRYGGIIDFFFKTGSYLKDLYGDSWDLETEEHAQNLSDGFLFLLSVVAAGALGADIQYGWDADPSSPSPLADSISDRTLTVGFTGKTEDASGNTVSAKIISSFVLLPGDHQGPALIIRVKGSGSLTIPLKQVFLFAMDAGFSVDLDNKNLSAGLRQEFEEENITFSASAKVSVEEAGQAWLIIQADDNPTFTIKREGDDLNVYVDEFSAKVSVSAPDAIIHLGEDGAVFPSSTDASVGFSLNHKPAGEFRAILGSPDGTHLFLGKSSLEAKASTTDYSVKAGTKESSFTLAGGDSDSFISQILPSDELKVDFNFGMGYSNKRGFFIEGGAGFLVAIPIHKSVGPLNLQTLTLGLKAGSSADSAAINLESSLSFAATLGPLTAAVDRIGLSSDLSFPDTGGNLGPVDIELGFKPPTGIGLAINGGGFKGGGFLSFDPDNHRYAGALELEYQDTIALKAIGLLATRMPDGSEGFSLLIIISAEFSPIRLGLGFTLNGVGGLLGLSRTARIERLRTGVKNNTLSSILFPENVVANANRIISDLRQVFPPQQGRFIFGPMAKIGWGTPTLVTIDLGLVIEVPDPVRLVLLGVVKALLPDEETKLLQLQVNFLGVIDFEAKMLSFDASLYDSKLLTYILSGDMAVRLSWGAEPNFLLTVGGFHPDFDPPSVALPDLRRLSLQLLAGKNPRLTLETYFAITSNTVQFGAKLELYAAAGKFNVYGFLAFDVLFQFNPFYFIAAIGAMLALRVGSSSIASISLSLTLDGPTPWHAKGTAKLKLFWFLTVKVRFDKTFGEERNTRLDDIAVLPLLQAALADKGNWEAQIPEGRKQLTSLKEIEAISDQVIAHPYGVLTIKQKVVPLNIDIQKFGHQLPSDGNRFIIEQVQAGEPGDTETLTTDDADEFFAPAQFFEKTDAQKLSSKSFERYDAGVRLTESEEMDSDYAVRRVVEYELFYMDEQRDQQVRRWPGFIAPEFMAFNVWATKGAIADSPLSFTKRAKSALAPDEVQVTQEQFSVVNVSDLQPVNDKALVSSEAGAYSLMNQLILENPALEGEIQVVPSFEASG